MGGCEYRMRKLCQARAIVLIVSLLAAIYLNLILSTALGGTENGEFCPTCPDWTDLDGWLAKKDAYEKAQMNEMLQKGQANISHASGGNQAPSLPPQSPANGYPEPSLFSTAAASPWAGVAVLDARAPQEYHSGHIPGARNLYWKDMQKGGALDPDLAESALCKAGINNSDRIMIYGGSDEGAAFVFWAMSYLGQKDISLLDGGIDAAWSAGIRPEKSVPSVPPSNYAAKIVPWLRVTPKNLEGLLSLADIQILDARDFADYGMNRLTSSSIPLTAENLYDDSRIKDASTLKELLDRRSLNEKGTQIVYGTPQAYHTFRSIPSILSFFPTE